MARPKSSSVPRFRHARSPPPLLQDPRSLLQGKLGERRSRGRVINQMPTRPHLTAQEDCDSRLKFEEGTRKCDRRRHLFGEQQQSLNYLPHTTPSYWVWWARSTLNSLSHLSREPQWIIGEKKLEEGELETWSRRDLTRSCLPSSSDPSSRLTSISQIEIDVFFSLLNFLLLQRVHLPPSNLASPIPLSSSLLEISQLT